MAKFNGIPKHTFYLHLKDIFRFYHQRDKISKEVLQLYEINRFSFLRPF